MISLISNKLRAEPGLACVGFTPQGELKSTQGPLTKFGCGNRRILGGRTATSGHGYPVFCVRGRWPAPGTLGKGTLYFWRPKPRLMVARLGPVDYG